MDNVTLTFRTDTENDVYFYHYWRQLIWTVLFAIITVVGTIGNFTIIWIVVAHRNMRTVTNLFLVNMALADGLVASLCVPYFSFQGIYGYWPFGNFVCKLVEICVANNIGISILTLSMIAFVRYRAIMYPFKPKMGQRKTVTIMVVIWLVSILTLSPNWIYIQTIKVKSDDRGIELCRQQWPDLKIEEIYRICVMVGLYFLPLLCIGFSYGRISVKLWGYEAIGAQSQTQLKLKRAEKRIVKMLIAVVSIFAICWLPFHLMFIAAGAGILNSPRYYRELFFVAFFMGMSNLMYNPIIYCLMNAKFRIGFKKAYRWCPCIQYDPVVNEIHFSNS